MHLRTSLTPDDVVAFNVFHRKKSLSQRAIRFVAVWGVGLWFLFMPFVWSSYDGYDWRTKLTAGLLVTVPYVLVMALLYRWLSNLQIRRLYAEGKNSGLFCEHLLSITQEGLTDKTESGEIRSAWKGIERLEVTPDYAFAYFNAVTAHVISRKRVVEGDFDAFVGELRHRIGSF